jgi:hypothetical protein
MEEAPENGKELSNSAHANGMNEYINKTNEVYIWECSQLIIDNQ